MDLNVILNKTLNTDNQARAEAETQIQELQKQDYTNFLTSFGEYFLNANNEVSLRQAAGLSLKNSLFHKDYNLNNEYTQRWLNLDPSLRVQVKEKMLESLSAQEANLGTVAAQIVQAIAAIELPMNHWDDLMTILANYMQSGEDRLKINTLKTIGYICEFPQASYLQSQSSQILNVIVNGSNESQSTPVRIEAFSALYNSLAFAHHNFEVPDERNYIMGQICEAATKTGDIQVKAFECLVRIAQLYYFIIEEYLSTFLGNIIKNALTSDNTDLVHQAIEFWSTMNDSEIELKQNMEYYDDEDINVQYDSATGHRNIVVRSLPLFVPEILTLMIDDDEDVEEDEWTVAKAAATCLRLTAQNVCDQLLSHVSDFIIGNIESQEWANREAAVMALGTVMDGPSIESLLPFIDGSLNLLSKLINDPSTKVKDSAVWTLSQICLVASEFLASKGLIKDIVGAFLNTLSGEPSIVTHACSGLIALGEQINCDETAQSSPLSHIYKDTLETLVKFTSNNAYNARTLTSAYEAISSWARKCPEDCLDITRDIYMEMLARLTSLTDLYRDPNNSNNLNRLTELQSNVCVVMTSLIRRIGPQIALVSDQTMTALFAIIDASNKNTTAAEDVFITISAIITVMGPDFERYLEQFHPLLCLALQNPAAPQLTSISIGIVGDLARSLQTSFAKYSADYMTLLGGLLSSSNVDTSIKPTILSTFGDIAQAICEQYQPYIAPTVEKLLQAKNSLDSQTSLMDPDALACAILDAYTGMIQGLHVNGYANFFHEFVQYPVDFLHTFSQTMDSYEEYVLRRAVGLIGDLCEAYSDSDAGSMLKQEFIARIVKYARTRRGPDSEQTRLLARWAKDKMKRIGAY